MPLLPATAALTEIPPAKRPRSVPVYSKLVLVGMSLPLKMRLSENWWLLGEGVPLIVSSLAELLSLPLFEKKS